MRRLNRAGVLALTSAAALAGSLLTSAPAQAASSPIAACGSSYHVIDKHSLGGATVYLLYNGKTNCVVTWRNKPSSKRVYLKALIHRERQPWKVDGGKFTTYAGPVKIDARGYCVQWGGDYGKKQWTSKFGHCGK